MDDGRRIMTMTPISGTALQGIQRGLQRMQRNAAEIASANMATNDGIAVKDGVRAMVELHQNAQLTITSLAVLKASDQVIGSLLDIKA